MSATVASGRVFDAFLGPDLSDAHAVPRPLVQRERARGCGRAPPPRAHRGVRRARERPRPFGRAARVARRSARVAAGGGRRPAAWPHGRCRARAPDRRAAVGTQGLCRGGRAWRAVAPARRRRRPDAAPDRHLRGDPPDRRTSSASRSTRSPTSARPSRERPRSSGWTDWSEAQARMIRSAGQWRAPVDFDAAGPEGKLAPEGRAVIVVRVERLPRPDPAPVGHRGRPRRDRPVGHGIRRGPAHRRFPPHPLRPRT